MIAETKCGKIIIENRTVKLKTCGIFLILSPIYEIILYPLLILRGINLAKKFEINQIEIVEYCSGIPNLIRPHIKIYSGNGKPRLVIFKKPILDIRDYMRSIAEMEKVLREFRKLGIKTIRVDASNIWSPFGKES